MLGRLSPKQLDSVLNCNKRLNIWDGSVRSGKTVASQVAWLRRLRTGPTGDRYMVGKTELTIRRNVLNPLLEILGPSRMTISQHEAMILGQRCYLIGANDERSESKIRGATAVDVFGDELTLWPESFFDMMLSRMSVEGGRFYGSTNADGPRHWLKTRFIDRVGELDMARFQFKLEDNPYLPDAYVAQLRSEMTGLWKKRFIDGLWVLAEGAIWDNFDPDETVIDGLPFGVEIREYWVGLDYGTANAFVALLIGTGSDGQTYVLDEYRWDSRLEQRQKTDGQYSADLARWIGEIGVTPVAWYVDPSAASFRLQLQQDHGWPVVEANNDVLDGIRHVGQQITAGMRILSGCVGLIAECESYVWDKKAQERGEDKPSKINDHGPDALRYGTYTHAGRMVSLAEYGWVA